MAFSVQMPALGESVTEGTVTRWLKQEGDRVEVDEPLLEVSTDKVDTEIPSPAAGVLQKIVAQEDETVEVGAELAVIGDGSGGDAAPAPAPAQEAPAEEAQPEQAPEPVAEAQKEEAPAPSDNGGGSASGTPVVMPALGESVTEGTVTRWLKQVGDSVEVDEPLLEVSTDKVDTEIPSPVAGTLLDIKVAEDETADVGAVLAIVGAEGAAPAAAPAPQQAPAPKQEQAPAPKQEQEAPKQEAPKQETPKIESAPAPSFAPGDSYAEPSAEAEVAKDPSAAERDAEPPAASGTPTREATQGNGAGDAGYLTPLVRKLAADKGVDLSGLTGTGVGGRIRKQDVLDAAEAAEKAKAAPAPAAQPAAAASKP